MTTFLTFSPRRRKTPGFTLVELLVVIAIIGTLVALLLPAVQAARATARLATCTSNMGQFAKGMINYEATKQRFPGYVEAVQRSDKTYAMAVVGGSGTPGPALSSMGYASTSGTNAANRQASRLSWAAIILPELERQDIWDRIIDPTFEERIPFIESFVCPSDSDATANPNNAALSYSANAGTWDWSGSNFQESNWVGDVKENGIFHNRSIAPTRNSPTRKPVTMRLSSIRDGANTTLMFGENIHKNDNYAWLGVQRGEGGEQHFGFVWVANPTPTTGSDQLYLQAAISQESGTEFPSNSPFYAHLSSNHSGGVVNVAFAGGNVETMRRDVDYVVYQQLMTPVGSKCEDLHGGGDIVTFRSAPPVSEKDYR